MFVILFMKNKSDQQSAFREWICNMLDWVEMHASSGWRSFLSGSASVCTLLLSIRWSWRGSVGEAGVARWPWTTWPWGKAPAQRSTIWGDSDWQKRERQQENKRGNHLKENWLCCDIPLLCLASHCRRPPPPCHPSQSFCERYPKCCASAEQWVPPVWVAMNKKTELKCHVWIPPPPPPPSSHTSSHSVTSLPRSLHDTTYHGSVLCHTALAAFQSHRQCSRWEDHSLT